MMVPSASTVVEPLLPFVAEATLSVSPSTSPSLPRTPIFTAVSTLVAATSSMASGASLTGLTVTATAAVSVPPLPSLTV
ncbi:hypothetical protein R2601_04538 [Salipiger bermudensis HTCC2601]|uniref:Uncharacterized protein n=1 Tax=Salipiger bermudensis (strain DSM 26914 / JCM 13377 / KCTC 12554 / HTCC2601) TaxID=314265 RepID=Q0FVT8_SALBH|nr:hypothetical protein R2601_04538 [Salipiger bermudensis HTCC2601]